MKISIFIEHLIVRYYYSYRYSYGRIKKKGRRNKLFKQIIKVIEEIGSYIEFFVKSLIKKTNKPTTKFVIFSGRGRAGSTLLCNLLDSHPQIRGEGEILSYRTFSLRLFLKIRCAISKKKIYGFKVFLRQLTRPQEGYDPRRLPHYLHKQGWKIIYLTRRNIVRQAISALFRNHRKRCGMLGRHRITDGPYKLEKVHINCDELIRIIKRREDILVKEREVLEGLPYITIVYEDDLLRSECHQKTLDRIFDYLGVPSYPVKTNLVRLTTDRLSDFIQNHEEVVNFISNTEYAKFLLG